MLKTFILKPLALLFVLLLFLPQITDAQEIKALENSASIAFLGTFHFAGSSDVMSLKLDDLHAEKRQEEIKHLVESLANYRPTKVILEYPFGNSKLDSVYQQYRLGKHDLTINERQQLGFRLADQLGHEHIYVADHRLNLPFDELMKYLQENNQMDQFQNLMNVMQSEVMNVWQKAYDSLSIQDFFVFMNEDKYDAMNRNVYLQYINSMGDAQNPMGVDVVTTWWSRNFMIMRHIDELIIPEDRVLVIFGQGHTAILKDIYKARTDLEFVDILQYLRTSN